MKRMYYVVYWADYANTYSLYHVSKSTEAAFLERCPNAERISRADAIALCRKERRTRKHDNNFAGYGDTYIWPSTMVDSDQIERDNYYFRHLDSSGFIIW